MLRVQIVGYPHSGNARQRPSCSFVVATDTVVQRLDLGHESAELRARPTVGFPRGLCEASKPSPTLSLAAARGVAGRSRKDIYAGRRW